MTRWDLPKFANYADGTLNSKNNSGNSLGYKPEYNHYGEGNTGRPDYAQNIYDSSLDRAWTYDQAGRLIRAYTGKEARTEWGPNPDGPYARGSEFDTYGT